MRLRVAGPLAVVGACAATTLAAALARASGLADLEVSGGEPIPVSGVGFVTAVATVTGALIAAALRRWSADPATRFLQVTLPLAAVSLVPPFLVGAYASTTATLVALHLLAAALAVPLLALASRRETAITAAAGSPATPASAPRG